MELEWKKVLEDLEARIGSHNVKTWIEPLAPGEYSGSTLRLRTPNGFFRRWLSQNYLHDIESSVANATGSPCRIMLEVAARPQGDLFPALQRPQPPPSRTPRSGTLIPGYTFDKFVVGTSNQFAHAASVTVAQHPGRRYNPLFIYGANGLGKTHLANAIGHAALERWPNCRIQYLSAESFMNELIRSLRRDRMEEFKARFRRADALIIDDVQGLARRERTQEEFFYTFNALRDSHRQIVLTADTPPRDIPNMNAGLVNRFEAGLVADIQPPDLETRVAILLRKAESENIKLPHQVAHLVAAQITTDVRALEGAFVRLAALSSVRGTPITPALAQDALRGIVTERSRTISIDDVQQAVCNHFGVGLADLLSPKRAHSITHPRQIGMYLARKICGASFPFIGERFGGRDHSTAMHAFSTVMRRLQHDQELRLAVEQVERALTRGATQRG